MGKRDKTRVLHKVSWPLTLSDDQIEEQIQEAHELIRMLNSDIDRLISEKQWRALRKGFKDLDYDE